MCLSLIFIWEQNTSAASKWETFHHICFLSLRLYFFHSPFLALFSSLPFPFSLELLVFNSLSSSYPQRKTHWQNNFLNIGEEELGADFTNICWSLPELDIIIYKQWLSSKIRTKEPNKKKLFRYIFQRHLLECSLVWSSKGTVFREHRYVAPKSDITSECICAYKNIRYLFQNWLPCHYIYAQIYVQGI